MTASTIVMMRVMFVSFFLPSSPCLERRSSAGMPTVRSCTIMDALMYGPIPSANSVPFASAPPVTPLISPKKSFVVTASVKRPRARPGTGI